VDQCLSRADLALYLAKRGGRNRVENFSSIQVRDYRPAPTNSSPERDGSEAA
jgi:hypothetical protein